MFLPFVWGKGVVWIGLNGCLDLTILLHRHAAFLASFILPSLIEVKTLLSHFVSVFIELFSYNISGDMPYTVYRSAQI